jgi:hypothetical protein
MTDDKSLFIEKYIITGLHKIETDGYWCLINDIFGRIGALLKKSLGQDYDLEEKVFFESKADAKDIIRQAFILYSEDNKKFGYFSWEPPPMLVSDIEIISALNSIGAKVGNVTSKPFETRQKSVDITEFDVSISMTISYEFRVKKVNKSVCNVEYFGNEYEFEKIENIYSEWFEAKNKQRVHLRVDKHPIYIIYPGALRSEQ